MEREPRVVSIGAAWVRNPERLGEFGLGNDQAGRSGKTMRQTESRVFLVNRGVGVRGVAQQRTTQKQATLSIDRLIDRPTGDLMTPVHRN